MRIAVAGGTGTVGRHVVAAAGGRGHDVTVLTRRDGHDLETGAGLAGALDGIDAVIDVTSVVSLSGRRAREFFTNVTGNLLRAGADAGVGHHVALSIVGIDGIDDGHYAGKLAQEALLADGPVPHTIQRATQFLEFAAQVAQQTTFGPLTVIPKAFMRPVAAREVGARLVVVAEGEPVGGFARDLAGPRDERLADLVRRMYAFDGVRRGVLEVRFPGPFGRSLATGVVRGGDDALRGRITFDEWLRSPDHVPERAGREGTQHAVAP